MTERPSATVALLAFIFGFFCLAASILLSSQLARIGFGNGYFSSLYSIILQGVAFATPAVVYYHRRAELTPALRFRRLDPLCSVLIVLAALVGVFALNWVSVYWMMALKALGLSVTTGSELAPRTLPQLMLALCTTALLPALFEELLFRGLLLPSFEKLGRWPAVLLSAVLFALPHASLEALPTHLLLGILLGWLVLSTSNLYASILFHGVYNASILVLVYFSMSSGSANVNALPSAGDAIRSMPMVVLLLGAFWMLTYAAMERGKKIERRPLPAPRRMPLTLIEKLLLGVSVLLMAAMELFAFIRMLPGVSA